MVPRVSSSLALLLWSTMIVRLMLCLFSLDGHLALNCDISSFSVRVWRSLCLVSFDTFQGGEIILLSVVDWKRWMISIFDVLHDPQSWIQMGFKMIIYRKTLFSHDCQIFYYNKRVFGYETFYYLSVINAFQDKCTTAI